MLPQYFSCVNPVTLDELLDIGEIWVEAAMALTTRELKVMSRLIRSQDRMAKTLVNTAVEEVMITG